MAEILSWAEATAQLWSANGSTVTVVYCRDVQATLQRESYPYRPPFATTHTHVDLQRRVATVSVGAAESPGLQSLKAMAYAAALGTVHAHIFALTPGLNTSGGVYAYSGTLSLSLGASEGEGEQRLILALQAYDWSAY
jgi:hypothetical protein